jgi:hypothetical protein
MNAMFAKVEEIKSDDFFSCITVRVDGMLFRLLFDYIDY